MISHNKALRIYLFIIVVIGSCYLKANSNPYTKKHQFRSINLSSHIKKPIYDIEQDNLGYIWFWSNNGLFRYDGYTIQNFKHEPDNPGSLSSSLIRDIIVDRKGILWVTTPSGVNRYDYSKGGFVNYKYSDTDTCTVADNSTYGLTIDKYGYVWVSGWDKSLCRYDYENDKMKRYHTGNSVVTDMYRYIKALGNTKLCLFTDNSQIVIFDTKTGEEKIIDPNIATVRNWRHVFEDRLGYYFFASASGNYALYNIKKGQFEDYMQFPKYKVFKQKIVNQVYTDKNGNTLFATNKGAIVFDSSQIFLTKIRPKDNCGNQPSVGASYLDKENNFLLALPKKLLISGACQGQVLAGNYKPPKEQGKFLTSFTTHGDTLFNLYANSLNKLVPKTGFDTSISLEGKPKLLKQVVAKYAISDSVGNKWLNTSFNGIYRIADDSLIHYKNTLGNNIFTTDRITKIVVDSSGYSWLATYNKGLFKFTGKDTYTHYTHDETFSNTIGNNWIFDIYLDKYNQLWVGTWDGLALYHPGKDSFQRYIYDQYTVINAIRKRNDSTIYLATSKGLWVFDVVKKRILKKYTSVDLLPDDHCTQIELDNRGRIWLGSKGGITIIDEQKEESINLNTFDGVFHLFHWANKSYKLRSGELIFNHREAQYIINPKGFKPNQVRLKTFITEFRLFNKPVRMGELNGYNESIELVKQLELNYDQSYFTIHYTAHGYSDVARYQYQYKLENYNNKWIDAGSLNQATYTNLDPGKYVFKVRCINEHNVVGHTRELAIVIVPPFWLTTWFKILMVFLIVSLIILTFRWRVYKLEKKKIVLEAMVQERTKDLHEKNKQLLQKQGIIEEQKQELIYNAKELSLKNQMLLRNKLELENQKNDLKEANESLKILNATKDKFVSIISHDLKNPFNTIIGFSQLLKLNFEKYPVDKNRRFLGNIHQTAESTYYLLENLLSWSRSQTGNINFIPEHTSINSITHDVLRLLKTMAQRKQITINNSIDDELHVFVDVQMIKTVFRNLLANAIKFTRDGGTITLYNVTSGTEVRFSIMDNGIGMDEETRASLFRTHVVEPKSGTDEESGTGLGLILCKEFVERHKGTIWVESEPGKGSTFNITIPINPQY